jgi:hypothetical protein
MTAKETSANYNRFVEEHADTVVHELDALSPEDLQDVLTEAIDSVLDVPAFNAELEREKEDSVWLTGVRRTVHEALRSLSLYAGARGQALIYDLGGDRVGSRRLRAVILPHHRACRSQHPAVEPSGVIPQLVSRYAALCPRPE